MTNETLSGQCLQRFPTAPGYSGQHLLIRSSNTKAEVSCVNQPAAVTGLWHQAPSSARDSDLFRFTVLNE